MRIVCKTQDLGDLKMDNFMNVNDSWLTEMNR